MKSTKLGLTVCLSVVFCMTLGCQSLLRDPMQREGSASVEASQKTESGATTVSDTAASKDFEATSTKTSASEATSSDASETSSLVDKLKEGLLAKKAEGKTESSFRIEDVKTVLAKPGGWMGTPGPVRELKESKNEASWNWYHTGIEEILAWSKENEPILRETLKEDDHPVAATNAAICLARMGDSSGVSILLGAVRSPRLEMSNRAAAAEALASLDSSTETVQKLIDEFCDRGKTPNPDLYRELVTGLARHIDPAGDRRFLDALNSCSAEVRLAAIEAWSKSRCEVLPDELVYLQADQSDKNRCAVMRALGTHDHPQRMYHLDTGLCDTNCLVHVAAVESLGQVGSQEAVQRLEEALKSNSPIVRAAAVRALAAAGRNEIALKRVEDEAWRVRLAVAEVLSREKDPDTATQEVAGKLLHDRSLQVQSQTLASVDAWPLAKSGPLLLDAMEKLGHQTRQDATTQLAKHWEPARRFPLHAPEEVRSRAITQLRSGFQKEFGLSTGDLAQAEAKSGQAAISPALITHAKRLIAKHEDPRCASADRYQIRQALRHLSPDPIAVLEHLVFQEHQTLPEEFYTTLLPELDPTFDILYRMQEDVTVSAKSQSKKLMSRRRAASELVRFTAEHESSQLALDRLAQLMLQETDASIWRSVLTAFADNESESMLQMIRIAIGHESSEIRLRACQWLATHPSPENFKLLRPALKDANQKVKVAAVQAIVASGNLDDAAPLKQMLEGTPSPETTDKLLSRLKSVDPSKVKKENTKVLASDLQEVESLKKLLGDTNETLRIEVAYALAAFGDEEGPQALKRLAQSRDANVRQKAAEAMGRLEDSRYTSFLITLLDDQLNVRRAALDALPKVAGHEAPVAGDRTPHTQTELVTRWKEWHAHRVGSSLR